MKTRKIAYDTYSLDGVKYEIDQQTGFMHIPLTLAKVGTMYYPEKDETRFFPPGVMKQALESVALIPITKYHPKGGRFVDASNVRELSRGVVKPGATFDGEYIRAMGVVQDQELIQDILSKRINQVSAGYEYEDDGCAGVYKKKDKDTGEKYDVALTYIKYNHAAGVALGRAGADVRFEIDQKGENDMADFEKELAGLKVGSDSILETTTVRFQKENKTAIDTMYIREKKLFDTINSQSDKIKTLEASLAVKEESLKEAKTAQDGMINKGDLNSLVGKLLDRRETAKKVGLDCAADTDPHIIGQKILEKMKPTAYANMKAADSLKSVAAVDAAYDAFKENLGFEKKVFDVNQALDGMQGQQAPKWPAPSAPVYISLENARG